MISGVSPGVDIGKNICPTKLVHGLFWITNKEQAMGTRIFKVNCLEYAVLNVIGVLEFVHHGTGVSICQLRRKFLIGSNRLMQLSLQIVQCDLVGLSLLQI